MFATSHNHVTTQALTGLWNLRFENICNAGDTANAAELTYPVQNSMTLTKPKVKIEFRTLFIDL